MMPDPIFSAVDVDGDTIKVDRRRPIEPPEAAAVVTVRNRKLDLSVYLTTDDLERLEAACRELRNA
jgi:hypothetical protein